MNTKQYKIIHLATSLLVMIIIGVSVTSAAIITVDDDGGSDYVSIQIAVDNASHSDTIIVYPGTYTENVDVDKGLTIISKSGNPDDTIVQAANPKDHVFEVTANNVTVSGFSLKSAGGTRENPKAGIHLQTAHDCIISNNLLVNNLVGIVVESSSNIYLANNTATSNELYGIRLQSSSNNSLISNEVSYNGFGISLIFSNNNELNNNTANSNNYYGISLFQSGNNRLINNTASNKKYGICLCLSNNNELGNNTANSNSFHGIFLWKSIDNLLSNNTANSNELYGIHLWGFSNNNRLAGNTANSNNFHGIFLWRSSGNLLSNNTANSNELYGIHLWEFSNNNRLTGNTASGNNDGIRLSWDSNNNDLSNNIANSNKKYGIYLEDSTGNTLNNNFLSGNYKGIKVTDNYENQIYNNKISDRYTWKTIFIGSVLIVAVLGISFLYIRKNRNYPDYLLIIKEWLFKLVIASVILVGVIFVLFVLYYFPGADLPDRTVYIEDLEWTNITHIDESTCRTSVSMNITYLYKESWMYARKDRPLPDDLPVRIQVLLSPQGSSWQGDVVFSENVILHYQQVYPFNGSFDFMSGNYSVMVEVQWKEYFDVPHPSYGEWRWNRLGGKATEISLC